jgi:multidrug efflux pump subunit AcrB
VRNVLVRMGGSYGDVRLARVIINLVKRADRSRRQQAIEKDLSEKLKAVPGVRFNFFGSNGSDQDLAISLVGDDPTAMSAVSDRMVRDMQQMPDLTNIKSSASLLRPELQIIPLYDRAAELGVSVAAISDTARLATLGEINANLAKFNLPDRQIPIRVEIDPKAHADLDQIRNLRVPSISGGAVPLESVAEIKFGSGTSQIKRRDRARQVTVGADMNGAPLGPALTATWTRCSAPSVPRWAPASCWCWAYWCCCSKASCSRSPSWRRCRCRWVARSWRCWWPASRFR